VDVADRLSRQLTRWIEAGLIDEDLAARIRTLEAAHADTGRWRWPIWLALALGALTTAAGTSLFVAAHWDSLSPAARFAVVTTLVGGFHVAAALIADRFPATAATLHAIGTAALGAGIYLAGQIFNLDEHWPGGLMLWTLGAAIAAAVLRTWPQTLLTAVLAPAWLIGEWWVAIHYRWAPTGFRVITSGVFLLALSYLTNERTESGGLHRRALTYLGAVCLLPAAVLLATSSQSFSYNSEQIATTLQMVGWTAALGLPLALALAFRGVAVWPNVVASGWVLALFTIRVVAGDAAVYAWYALGAIGVAAWGVVEQHSERVNVGVAAFALTVLVFYFSQVMDKLGRSASLITLGLLFLAGGWLIERTRRRLVVAARGGAL
jgi:uncharacterized membrane protein